jgi:DNA-binding PadR family transcriptional regulator
MTSQQIKGHLDGLLMAILELAPCHGYGIIEQLRTRSDDIFDLPEGTVYPALHRLERNGMVTSKEEPVGGRTRRVYRLSNSGRTALAKRRRDWSRFAFAVSTVLGAAPA